MGEVGGGLGVRGSCVAGASGRGTCRLDRDDSKIAQEKRERADIMEQAAMLHSYQSLFFLNASVF